MFDLAQIFAALAFPKEQVVTIVALILLDLLLGVASAIKRNAFVLSRIAGFYRTNVVPGLLGWAALAIAGQWISPGLLGTDALGPITANGGWGLVAAALLGSIGENAAEIWPGLALLGKPNPPANPKA